MLRDLLPICMYTSVGFQYCMCYDRDNRDILLDKNCGFIKTNIAHPYDGHTTKPNHCEMYNMLM